jgi:hypothetical protein
MFTYDPATDLGKLRLAIGDTDQTNGVRPNGKAFSDEELNLFLQQATDWQHAVSEVLRTLANQYASQIGVERFGAYSRSNEKRANELSKQAATWERELQAMPDGWSSSIRSVSVPVIPVIS